MISRKSFCQRIAAVVVAVALAPEIAFGVRLTSEIPEPKLDLQGLMDQFYAMMRANHARGYQADNFTIYTDSEGVEACERWLRQYAAEPA